MSVLGPTGLAGIAMASSIAGSTSRNPASVDRSQVEQAEQQLLADDARLADRDLDDSIETQISHGQVGDRDPDGRLPWTFYGQPQGEGEDNSETPAPPPHVPDADGTRGGNLDLDA